MSKYLSDAMLDDIEREANRRDTWDTADMRAMLVELRDWRAVGRSIVRHADAYPECKQDVVDSSGLRRLVEATR